MDLNPNEPFKASYVMVSLVTTSLAFLAANMWSTFFQNFLNAITPNETDDQRKQPLYSFLGALFVSIFCVIIIFFLFKLANHASK